MATPATQTRSDGPPQPASPVVTTSPSNPNVPNGHTNGEGEQQGPFYPQQQQPPYGGYPPVAQKPMPHGYPRFLSGQAISQQGGPTPTLNSLLQSNTRQRMPGGGAGGHPPPGTYPGGYPPWSNDGGGYYRPSGPPRGPPYHQYPPQDSQYQQPASVNQVGHFLNKVYNQNHI